MSNIKLLFLGFCLALLLFAGCSSLSLSEYTNFCRLATNDSSAYFLTRDDNLLTCSSNEDTINYAFTCESWSCKEKGSFYTMSEKDLEHCSDLFYRDSVVYAYKAVCDHYVVGNQISGKSLNNKGE
jgi:hypothetical protein